MWRNEICLWQYFFRLYVREGVCGNEGVTCVWYGTNDSNALLYNLYPTGMALQWYYIVYATDVFLTTGYTISALCRL